MIEYTCGRSYLRAYGCIHWNWCICC